MMTYNIKNTVLSGLGIFLIPILFIIGPKNIYGQSGTHSASDMNYVLTNTVRVGGITSVSQILGRTKSEVIQGIEYFDGLGRPLQSLVIKGSPGFKDIIKFAGYDSFGRLSRDYLPFVDSSATATGNFRGAVTASQLSFYNPLNQVGGVVRTNHPFSVTLFEPSPESRISQQGTAGSAWQPADGGIANSGHTIKTAYGVNNNMALVGDPAFRRVRRYDAVVANGITRNLEDAGWYNENELSLTIVKNENWSVGRSGTIEDYKDKLGRLVLKRIWENEGTPLSTYYVYDDMDNLSFVLPPGAGADGILPSASLLEQYCYMYRYDGRKRLIEKKIPGKDGWEFTVYNRQNLPVLTQDPKQAQNSKWSFKKYDASGRAVMTGDYVDAGGRAELQAAVNSFAGADWETFTNAVTSHGYNNLSFPTTYGQVYTVNYYDHYNFSRNSFGVQHTFQSQATYGMLTGTEVNVLGTTDMLLSVFYYDAEGRLLQTKSKNYRQGTDIVTNTYSFPGEILSTKHEHTSTGNAVTINQKFDYDHLGRLIKTWHGIDKNPDFLLEENVYNHIGQLKAKKIHDGKQKTSLTYNERGWLKKSISPEFTFELKYEDGNTPQYNGNVSGQCWGTPSNLDKNYAYAYDYLNRLTSGVSSEGKNETITYNHMGNIMTLARNPFGTNSYSYSGNRLENITGVTSGSFSYDANGNVNSDGTRGIGIGYNVLNLPQTISGNANISYVYDAGGNKIKKTFAGSVSEYIGGIHYVDNVIQFIQTPTGRALINGGTYKYEHNLVDHLGNVRYSFDIYNNAVREMQKDDYYPFGLQIPRFAGTLQNKYLYNGKELQDGIAQFDYGARFYDPVIGRWNSIDPLAEKTRRYSPYNYGMNNPVMMIDPDGMETKSTHTDFWGNVLAIYDDGDLGVYKHNLAEDKDDIDRNRMATGSTSGGGEKVGETYTPFGFADFNAFEKDGVLKDGSVKVGAGARIDFVSNWAQERVKAILDNNSPTFLEYYQKAGGGGPWDIKAHAGKSVYFGSQLWGKFVSARDAGNIVAGIVASNSIIPNVVIDYGFGLYNQSGNNKKTMGFMGVRDLTIGGAVPSIGIMQFLKIALTGEDKLTRDGINAGKRIFH
jgi:RHS repeat-associated protein